MNKEAFPLYAPVLPFLTCNDTVALFATNTTMLKWVESTSRKSHSDISASLQPKSSTCFRCTKEMDPFVFFKTAQAYHKRPRKEDEITGNIRFLCTICKKVVCWHCESSRRVNRCCLICMTCEHTSSTATVTCLSCKEETCPLHPERFTPDLRYCYVRCQVPPVQSRPEKRKRKSPSDIIVNEYRKHRSKRAKKS